MTSEEWKAIASKVNAMSNWQRNQWAKDGYKVHRIDHFLHTRRPKSRDHNHADNRRQT